MTIDNRSAFLVAVGDLVEPLTGRTLSQLSAQIELNNNAVTITVGSFNQEFKDQLTGLVERLVAQYGLGDIAITILTRVPDYLVDESRENLSKVKSIIAVASGKGGVGKSATAANLALALAHDGAAVGLLDADIYGPSVPIMLGVEGATPASPDGKVMAPVAAHGIVCNSLGFIIDSDKAAVWRGPMASGALQQLINDTQWPELDYLVIDMPPGTGDIQLTLAQKVPVSAALVITTPQNLALSDARRGVDMFNQVNIPVCGVVENMSFYSCEQCGHINHIFGKEGGDLLAKETGVPLLARLPLEPSIRSDADSGNPSVAADPSKPVSQLYIELARKVGAFVWSRHQAATDNVPIIEIQ
ncbi:iron-sulfur cluster carrier protein ApbC [Corallincola holothuriorum]|uniref:Iron-sulfur cluster carrier protein n=1 Tax=Corallincola holothuriorum TaxID=2282215 RepID=A0A368NSM9_9GAMM|nr:iron-sulfur cluster carrier protein ApbC [Corallincola holothuriorum]RCU52714.1 iron-sulfur cluster carrier protein ApbC [Corallincola holothuriorum]